MTSINSGLWSRTKTNLSNLQYSIFQRSRCAADVDVILARTVHFELGNSVMLVQFVKWRPQLACSKACGLRQSFFLLAFVRSTSFGVIQIINQTTEKLPSALKMTHGCPMKLNACAVASALVLGYIMALAPCWWTAVSTDRACSRENHLSAT